MRLPIGLVSTALGFVVSSCSGNDHGALASGGAHSAGGSTANGGASNGGNSSAGSQSTAGRNPSSGDGGTSTGGSGTGGDFPQQGACPVFTTDDAWNTPVTGAGVDAAWTKKLQTLVGAVNLHPDYGNSGAAMYGIPINIVPSAQPKLNVTFLESDESDVGPYAFPDPITAKVEGGTPNDCSGDCHLLAVQQGSCTLYEGDDCHFDAGWHCYSGAIFDLRKNSYGQRTKGFTSADAAGLAITPGLIRYDEANSGAIHHAIRFTVPCTTNKYVKPASHFAVPTKPAGCAGDPNAPPMGLRVRLKAGVTVKNPSQAALAVITAMQTYGMILADNGSAFFFQGEASKDWTDSDITPLKEIPASAFEVVTVPPLEP